MFCDLTCWIKYTIFSTLRFKLIETRIETENGVYHVVGHWLPKTTSDVFFFLTFFLLSASDTRPETDIFASATWCINECVEYRSSGLFSDMLLVRHVLCMYVRCLQNAYNGSSWLPQEGWEESQGESQGTEWETLDFSSLKVWTIYIYCMRMTSFRSL